MGMKLVWKDIAPAALAVLLRNPDCITDFIAANPIYRRRAGSLRVSCPEELSEEWRTPSLSIGPDGKSWTDVAYLLGRSGNSSHLANELIKGGTPFGPQLGYGRARYRTPEQVLSLVNQLPSPEELRARFGTGGQPFPADGRPEWEEARDGRLAAEWRQEDTAVAVEEYGAILAYHRQAGDTGRAMLSYFV
jgi:hypothetical protein